MIITTEKNLSDFEFWGVAKENVSKLTERELDLAETYFEEHWEDGISDTYLNDMFGYDILFVLDLLGISEEDFYNR